MADGESSKSFWEVLGDQIKSPWDWVAAGVGALGGGVVSATMSGADLGTTIGAGAIAGVTVRKAAVASLQGRSLRKQAMALRALIEKRVNSNAQFPDLAERLDAEIELWDAGAMDIDEFGKHLGQYREEYRRLIGQ